MPVVRCSCGKSLQIRDYLVGRRLVQLAIRPAVQLSNKAATLALGFYDGQQRAQHTIQYCTPTQRWVFDALRERLGSGWREESESSSPGSAAGLPLTVIGFLLFF